MAVTHLVKGVGAEMGFGLGEDDYSDTFDKGKRRTLNRDGGGTVAGVQDT